MSNYASYSSLGVDPKAPSPESMATIPLITSTDHRNALIHKYLILVIDNFTDWCGPCKSVSPLFAQLAQQYQNTYPNQIGFIKENVEHKHSGAPTVRGVPCFHFYVKSNYIPELTVTGGDIKSVKTKIDEILTNLHMKK